MSPRPRKSPPPGTDPLAEFRAVDKELRGSRPSETDPAPADAGAAPDSRRYDDLLDVAVSLTSTLDLRDILNNIVDGIIRVTDSERGFLLLREGDGAFSTYTGRYRDRREWDERAAREFSQTIVSRVIETHEPFVGSDIAKIDDLATRESIQAHRIRSAVCLPLLYKDSLIGIIYADSGFVIPPFLESDRSILRAFSAQAALAVENSRRHGELLDRRERLEQQNVSLRQQLSHEVTLGEAISRNRRMLEAFDTVERLAPRELSVLIEGETGTGKELLAKAIHDKSARRDGPFLPVNCASIPEALAEDYFFGHIRGAFTGADQDRPGVFESADQGTVFLDEVGDMPAAIQPKLLRVLESGEVSRVGEVGRVRKVDVRVVAATNVDLRGAVKEGKFREDLYHRLGVARIVLPPLRERREDIVLLAELFLKQLAKESGEPPTRLSQDARAFLAAQEWTGNARELRSAVRTAAAYQDENHVIHAAALERFARDDRATRHTAGRDAPLHDLMAEFEKALIEEALAKNDNNVSAAARKLKISRQQLHHKIKTYGIQFRDE